MRTATRTCDVNTKATGSRNENSSCAYPLQWLTLDIFLTHLIDIGARSSVWKSSNRNNESLLVIIFHHNFSREVVGLSFLVCTFQWKWRVKFFISISLAFITISTVIVSLYHFAFLIGRELIVMRCTVKAMDLHCSDRAGCLCSYNHSRSRRRQEYWLGMRPRLRCWIEALDLDQRLELVLREDNVGVFLSYFSVRLLIKATRSFKIR
jgi:hypothetical protein